MRVFSINKKHRLILWIIPVFLILAVSTISGFNFYYKDKILPFTYISSIDVGGLSIEQAEKIILEKINIIELKGIEYVFNEVSINITPTIISPLEKDASFRLIYFEIEQTLNKVFEKGHEKSIFQKTKSTIQILTQKNYTDIEFDINKKELQKILQNKFSEYEKPTQNAGFIITNDNEIITQKEKVGYIFDYEKAINDTEDILKSLYLKPVILIQSEDIPEMTEPNIQNAVSQAKKILQKEKITLVFEDKEWVLYRDDFKQVLSLDKGVLTIEKPQNASEKIAQAAKPIQRTSAWLSFDPEKTEILLKEIKKEINIEPQDAKITIENNKAVEFLESKRGLEININKTALNLNIDIIDNNKDETNLVVNQTIPKINTQNANEFGIKEKLGVGSSNFSGSPQNRIHNIRIGSQAVNGTLIKPGEEFSLITTLGKIDESTGYRPELVIKGDETVPEYGGGLCQVGTTAFRAALSSGLPITERRNHSYRVSYYEPAGTDATIYSPKPDFKFLNDTENYILIQTKMIGTELIFEFWGSKDGRKIEQTEPEIYNIKKPPPTKLIETTELEQGKKKCTERAHNGASAKFDYIVTYPDGEVKEKTFKSYYAPWQEVCLIGVTQEELDAKNNPEEMQPEETNLKERIEILKEGFILN